MKKESLFAKVQKHYRRGGVKEVLEKSRKIGSIKMGSAHAKLSWKVHGGMLPDDDIEMLRQWEVYTFLKRKYADLIRKSDYLSAYEKENCQTPKIIWWCWLQGEEKAPALCKANLAALRKNYPDYDIRVVTSDNIAQYVEMPAFIEEKFRNEEMQAAHYSDILRILLLIEYGGVWIDSTVFSSKRATDILEEPFFVYQNWMKENKAIVCSNWMIVSVKNNPILLLIRDLLYQYWKNYSYAIHYYIYHFFFHMATEKYQTLWKQMPLYSNVPVHVLQFELFQPYQAKRFEQIMRMADFHKLTHHLNASTEGDVTGTNYEHIITMMGEKVDAE